MQEMLVSIILIAAICVIWKHMAPRSLRSGINQACKEAALRMGWTGIAKKPAKKTVTITHESGCALCHGCKQPEPPSGCEIRIRPKNIQKR